MKFSPAEGSRILPPPEAPLSARVLFYRWLWPYKRGFLHRFFSVRIRKDTITRTARFKSQASV